MGTSDTHIIATIGPRSGDLAKMQNAGMTMARLNMSHGTQQGHASYIEKLTELENVQILLDLSGPRSTTTNGIHKFDPNQKNLTPKDLHDLSFGIRNNIDWVALSYVSKPEDILELRKEIRKLGSNIPIMAKIEHPKALKNITEIITVSDAIMIGRGDLGNEVGLQLLPSSTLLIIKKSLEQNKPVVVGTQILTSMIKNKQPTRAETTDAWLHGYVGATGIMLSEETAVGENPKESVRWASNLFTQGRKDRKNKPFLAGINL